jgi:hypothetical protein
MVSAIIHDHRAGRIMWYNCRRDALGFLSPSVSFRHSPQEWPINASVVASGAWTWMQLVNLYKVQWQRDGDV